MKRLLTGLIFGLILIGVIALRNISLIFFDVFLGLVIVLANYEFCEALEKQSKHTMKYVTILQSVVILELKVEMKVIFIWIGIHMVIYQHLIIQIAQK